MILYPLLFSLFLSEIFVFNEFRQLNYYIALIFPVILFFVYKNRLKQIHVPKSGLFYLAFIILSIISSSRAIDSEIAFNNIFVYISGLLIIIFSFNLKEQLKKNLFKFIIISSVIFLLIYLINISFKLHLFNNSASLLYQYDHIQLGNLLVLPFIILFPNFLSWIFFIFVLFSYSRTAYLALIIGIFASINNNFLKILIVLITLTFLFVTTKNYLFTKNKKPFGFRNIYFNYAISSIKESPLFGVGPGNFYYAASKRLTNYNQNTTTAHNIFLDILAENGVLAALFFMLFVYLFIKKAKKDIFFWLFISLTVIFLFDFSYRFNSFLFLWLLLSVMISNKKESISINSQIFFISLLLVCQLIVARESRHIKNSTNPILFKKEMYFKVVENEIIDYQPEKAIQYLDKLGNNFDRNFVITWQKALYYNILGQADKSLFYYKKTVSLYPFALISDSKIADKILKLNQDIYIDQKGTSEASKFFIDLVNDNETIKKDSQIYKGINNFCLNNGLKCYNNEN